MAWENDPVVKINSQRAIQFQPFCEHCFRTNFDNQNREYQKLIACEDCQVTFFCSKVCQSASLDTHKGRQCSDLQEFVACEYTKTKLIRETGELGVIMPTRTPRTIHVPLMSFGSWKEYFAFSDNPLASAVNDSCQPVEQDLKTVHFSRILKIATDSSSYYLTILAGLETSLPDLASRTSLTLHLLGPSMEELKTLRLSEELLHLLPNLRTLILGFVGPDYPAIEHESKGLEGIECCPDCTSAGRTRQIFHSKSLYHDFSSKNTLAVEYPPDMLIAFNSGHEDSDSESWQPTLQMILDMGQPAVFTTYNRQEALQEASVLEKMDADFVIKPEENQWKGLLPHLDTFEARYDRFYLNAWWYVVKGNRKRRIEPKSA